MAVVSPHGNGRRGRLIVAAAVAVIMIIGSALVWGGCGDSSNTGTTTSSQLDDEGVGASTGISSVGGTGGTTSGESGQGNVLVDYQWDQCTVDMQKRYGDLETAKKVCAELQTNYGSASTSQLPVILPQAETSVGATPLPGSTIPTGGGTQPGTSTPPAGNSGSGGGGGWDSGGIEITVPSGPGQ